MDSRFSPYAKESSRAFKVILHPTANFYQVWQGTATDGVDLTKFMSAGTQTLFQCAVTLNWNNELDGVNQPQPNQLLEIQAQNQTLWVGQIDAIAQYNISAGERSMELIAKTREQYDIWKTTPRVTQLYPALVDITYVAQDIAVAVGMLVQECAIPISSVLLPHSNTQFADMSAWEMINDLLLPAGMVPFIDNRGRLRGANKDLQSRGPDVVLQNWQVKKVTASRNKPPTSRVILKWLDPNLTQVNQQGRKLADAVMTMGFFANHLSKDVQFSVDGSQRAQNTYMKIRQSANQLIPVCDEVYTQTSQTGGRIDLNGYYWSAILSTVAIVAILVAAVIPDLVVTIGFIGSGGFTISVGRLITAIAETALFLVMMSIGTGVYEVWGTPYDFVHARNTTQAYDQSVPTWVDNPQEFESDLIANENHAQTVAVRELVWLSRNPQKWNGQIIEDLRLEYGDVIQFPDGSRVWLEDISRDLMRDAEPTVGIQGFLF